ncbi:hypothetical protein C8J57DRAFT_1477395 [Mycena rebaudengoi]|nr:hypothetical protein C8J57DRAFT_1477395 [Mycena rebaudengoi]
MPKKARPSSLASFVSTTQPQAARQAVFENCQQVSVSGGVFNVHANTNDSHESDFRHVRLGDLNLLNEVATQAIVEYQEIPHKRTGVVKPRVPEVVGVRRIHLAHVIGLQEDFTAVVYEGSDFEKNSRSTGLMQNSVKSFGDGIIYEGVYTI